MDSPYYKDPKARQEIDELLKKNATIQANLGTDSTDQERFIAKLACASILHDIALIDYEFAKILEPTK